MEDPSAWLNKIAEKICQRPLELVVAEYFDSPQAIVCFDKNGQMVIFSPASRSELYRLRKQQKSKRIQKATDHPLLNFSRLLDCEEVPTMQNGIAFDIELSLAWKNITKFEVIHRGSIWVYVMDLPK